MLWCCDDSRAAGGGVDVGRRAALMVLQIKRVGVKKALLSSDRLRHVHLRLTPPLHKSLSLHRKTPLPRTTDLGLLMTSLMTSAFRFFHFNFFCIVFAS